MSYLGSSAAPIPVAFSGVRTQAISGTGAASLFTLDRAVQAVTDIEVIVNNVQQSPFDGSYSIVNNGLGLQFSENPSAGTNNIYVVYRDQPLGSIIDPGAVRKSGDVMTGGLTVGGNVLASPNAGASRVFGVSGGTNTTVVVQAGAASGSGPNLELTADHYAYLDSNTTKFRSTDASLVYGGFDTAGRWTMPNQPAFYAYWSNDQFQYGVGNTLWDAVRFNRGGHYSTSTGRFTAPVAGVYHFDLQTQHYGSNTGNGVHDILLNGTAINARWEHVSGGTWAAGTIGVTIYLNAGDYVNCWSSAGVWWSDNSYFSGHLVG